MRLTMAAAAPQETGIAWTGEPAHTGRMDPNKMPGEGAPGRHFRARAFSSLAILAMTMSACGGPAGDGGARHAATNEATTSIVKSGATTTSTVETDLGVTDFQMSFSRGVTRVNLDASSADCVRGINNDGETSSMSVTITQDDPPASIAILLAENKPDDNFLPAGTFSKTHDPFGLTVEASPNSVIPYGTVYSSRLYTTVKGTSADFTAKISSDGQTGSVNALLPYVGLQNTTSPAGRVTGSWKCQSTDESQGE